MSWSEIKNLQTVSLKEIPQLYFDALREQVIRAIKEGKRLVQFFGDKTSDGIVLYVIIADDLQSKLHVASTIFTSEQVFPSMTPEISSAHLFEREFFEQCGIKPDGHPWLKPVRKGIAGINTDETLYHFFSMGG